MYFFLFHSILLVLGQFYNRARKKGAQRTIDFSISEKRKDYLLRIKFLACSEKV